MPLPPFPRRGAPPTGTRAVFRPPPDFAPLTSLFVNVQGETLTLQRDYPDFHPVGGWKVDTKDGSYIITAVNGLKLTCAQAPGGEP